MHSFKVLAFFLAGSGSNVAVSSSGCGEQLVSSLLAVNAAKALADNTDPLHPQFAGKLRQIFLSEFILFYFFHYSVQYF